MSHTISTQGPPDILVVTSEPVKEVVTVGIQGPAGPPGPAGSTFITANAGETIGGHRAVVLDANGEAVLADNTIPSHIARLAGVTAGAAAIGTPIAIAVYAVVTEPSWTWTPNGHIFLTSNGMLTQSVPPTGFLQIVGTALSATSAFINPREPIERV